MDTQNVSNRFKLMMSTIRVYCLRWKCQFIRIERPSPRRARQTNEMNSWCSKIYCKIFTITIDQTHYLGSNGGSGCKSSSPLNFPNPHFTFQIAVSVQYHAVGSRYSNYLVCGASWERCNFTFNSSFLPQKARCSRLRCAGAGGSTRRPLDAAPRMRAPARRLTGPLQANRRIRARVCPTCPSVCALPICGSVISELDVAHCLHLLMRR